MTSNHLGIKIKGRNKIEMCKLLENRLIQLNGFVVKHPAQSLPCSWQTIRNLSKQSEIVNRYLFEITVGLCVPVNVE